MATDTNYHFIALQSPPFSVILSLIRKCRKLYYLRCQQHSHLTVFSSSRHVFLPGEGQVMTRYFGFIKRVYYPGDHVNSPLGPFFQEKRLIHLLAILGTST